MARGKPSQLAGMQSHGATGAPGAVGPSGHPGPLGPISPAAEPSKRRPSDQRFRSFAERYLIARAPMLRTGYELEDGWKVLLDAKSLYTMIRRTGENIDPEDGAF